MSIDFLEEMERQILTGSIRFGCPGMNKNEWHFADSIEELSAKAQRTADGQRYEVYIYRIINKKDAVSADSFLVVRKLLKGDTAGMPNIEWSIVDSIEAAEMMRDVSQGPTPLFGAVKEQSFTPAK